MRLSKIRLYWNTVRYLKPSQVFYRIKKKAGMPCSLGVFPQKLQEAFIPNPVATIPELDFDPVFLARFPAGELMEDRITILHETEVFHWNAPWNFPNRTPLWNYTLHYFEYVFPLVKSYKDTGDKRYLDKFKLILLAWVEQNPQNKGGVGWDPYPTALRLTNWLSFYAHLEREISGDEDFRRLFLESVWEQWNHLARHLEKDLLGNHYFEDLKAMVLCALFFGDDAMLHGALKEFHEQCREQILPDGMHFELSPMYHKLIFEDVMRIAVALQSADKKDAEVESYLQPMLDVAYSLEEGLDRIPLFNDCGNNVAKSLTALCKAVENHCGIMPEYQDRFPDSGYYIFKCGDWKMIVDAGRPGPAYLPGHAHCDAMSFELFHAGKPVIVNCGTYAYQCEERAFFRSTAAHNTVMVDGVEQSECWGAFRMGKRIKINQPIIVKKSISMGLIDQNHNLLRRCIVFDDKQLIIIDNAKSKKIYSYFHDLRVDDIDNNDWQLPFICSLGEDIQLLPVSYAPEFGKKIPITNIEIVGEGKIQITFNLEV